MTDSDVSLPTVGAIAVVAYCLTNLVHEGVGHGGACLLVGGKPLELNAIFFKCDHAGIGANANRVIVAGGSIANLVLAAIASAWLRARRGGPGPLHYFLALMLALNILMPFGYLLFSGLGGFGDWAVFIEGLGPPLPLRALLAVTGAALYFVVAPKIVMPHLDVYIGRDPATRSARARELALYPYLLGSTTYVIAGLLNPEGWKLIVISAAATGFGGTSLLAWHPASPAAPERPAPLAASRLWLGLAVAAFVIFVGVFGPGVKLR